MPYTPVTFVDGVTPLNATNLNKVEDGVEAAERTENKGQPNGYPALNADGKVPSSQLPATGAALAVGEYNFSTTTSEPPASGGLRLNTADQTLATLLWLSYTTRSGGDVTNVINSIKVGDQLYVQEGDDATQWQLYDVTAVPVAEAGYAEIAVSFAKGGGIPFVNNDRVQIAVRRVAGGGGGGAELTYEGDFVAATEYQDGDVVVKDGVAYICVGGPTTVAPDPAPWGAAALAKVAYGTTLPAGPVDGQEAILVDSLTNPTYQWRFRYNAGSTSPYKWEFIGGTPLTAAPVPAYGSPFVKSTTAHEAFTGGPSLVLPRAGDYMVRAGLTVQYMGTGGQDMSGAIYNGTTEYGQITYNATGQYAGGAITGTEKLLAQAASTPLSLRVFQGAAQTSHYRLGWLDVTPVRVA